MTDRFRKTSTGISLDDPPHSRLFIVGPPAVNEDVYTENFKEFGTIEDIRQVKDRNTGEIKGVTFIKFSKTSEAAHALETLNGRALVPGSRPIKILIAAKEHGSKRDSDEEERLLRLFVIVPKTMTNSELHDYFKQFGSIEYTNIIKDKRTQENKGCAYVKYYKFSHAAKAFEECDRKYKPIFAEPRTSKAKVEEPLQSFADFQRRNNDFSTHVTPVLSSGVDEGYTKLKVFASPHLNQDQLWKLFDIIPGMDYCDVRCENDRNRMPLRVIAEVVYTSSKWAAHAKEKLHGFEYPPGCRLIVRPDFDSNTRVTTKPRTNDLMAISETISQAASLIRNAGLPTDMFQGLPGVRPLGLGIPSVTDADIDSSVPLPDPEPLADIDAEVVARCFIVCSTPIPNSALKAVFCRFGDLIDVYLLPNKACGYVTYASQRAADDAIRVLHGAEVFGIRLKVLVAEEKPDNKRKRQRTET